MSVPPLNEGGDQVTTTDLFPGMVSTAVGAPGSVAGVTEEEAADDGESPRLFLATTVKVKGVPFASPVKFAVKTFPTVIAAPVEGVTM
jgi:hypothetical protein